MPRKPPAFSWRKRAIGAIAVLAIALVLTLWLAWPASRQNGAIGSAAMEHTKAIVAFGPRPPDTDAHHKMERYITDRLQAAGAAVEQDAFTAESPVGPKKMTNIIGRLGKSGGRIIVLASHYDTKLLDNFVGANDGGSSTGLVLALAPILARQNMTHEIRLVFVDGEEAFCQNWDDCTRPGSPDNTYGSRHLAEKWKADGSASRIGAFILVDMIGDANLDLFRDSNSTPWLRDLVWKVAANLGHSEFLSQEAAYEDDHLPFLRAGVPAVDLIDLNYPPWHTADDTLDKLSPASMQTVGEVVIESINQLDRQR